MASTTHDTYMRTGARCETSGRGSRERFRLSLQGFVSFVKSPARVMDHSYLVRQGYPLVVRASTIPLSFNGRARMRSETAGLLSEWIRDGWRHKDDRRDEGEGRKEAAALCCRRIGPTARRRQPLRPIMTDIPAIHSKAMALWEQRCAAGPRECMPSPSGGRMIRADEHTRPWITRRPGLCAAGTTGRRRERRSGRPPSHSVAGVASPVDPPHKRNTL